jgi:hypothetical protein
VVNAIFISAAEEPIFPITHVTFEFVGANGSFTIGTHNTVPEGSTANTVEDRWVVLSRR